mmetsp:Transcript_6216/g.4689  ORF Transcript_6216/g.4689 Transcript_6216/m.4689 type:complete len:94 (+) Transcript_6216:275-556(+)|eukprot:CAMPEP_0202963928 /NCGR_PEP_ID=MMETSP1396-20130829/7991_1 /ASSEMBLY_ACC=CAM_ASM_000872 /TAXON_ID= /ORGANISM="Pseudokeronopsis sp., Strain Brazil" /LENGTH=93 /DNA_ID=CAMNT_0049685605 /DNA_START=196 /DNA_END=477 /DNA_ORIENTATION=-
MGNFSFTDANSMGKRRIHEDGELGYSFKLNHKDAKIKAEIMENRIRRLLFEEERAKKLSEVAKMKAEKMLEARLRHQREVDEKLRMYEEKLRG